MDNFNLTSKEKYLFKKENKEREHLAKLRREKIKKVITIILPVLLVAGGITWVIANYSPSENNSGIPQIEISSSEYDAGTVSMAGGLIKHTFGIKNLGQGDLKIDKIWTSCHCTTARLIVGDKKSPEFGMDFSAAFWSQTITSNQEGFLEVTFDPAYHGAAGIGEAVRAVWLMTNDPQNKKAEVRLMANVVP